MGNARSLYRKEIGLIDFSYREEIELYNLIFDNYKNDKNKEKNNLIINNYGINIMILLLSRISKTYNSKLFDKYDLEEYPYKKMRRYNNLISDDIHDVIKNTYNKLVFYINEKIYKNNLEYQKIIPSYKEKLEIKIDDFNFELIAITDNNEYDRVLLLLKTNDKFILFYRSNSELNTWRFASYDSYLHLYKGQNYITETFIHINLQKFINENYHKIPYSYIHKTILDNRIELFNIHSAYDIQDKDEINNDSRYKTYEYFILFNNNKCGQMVDKNFIDQLRMSEEASKKNKYTKILY